MLTQTDMDVVLFHTTQKRPLLIAPLHPSFPASASSPPDPGAWHKAKQRIVRTYDQLMQKFDYQEQVCASLRHASEVELRHASSLKASEAREIFGRVLKSQFRKHLFWLSVDGLVASMALVLTVIPGPNIFALYPAARGLSHFLACRGVKNVSHPDKLSLIIDPRIDRIEANLGHLHLVDKDIRDLEDSLGITNLKALLKDS